MDSSRGFCNVLISYTHAAGFLGPDGDWHSSAKAEGSLTARPTRRAGTKVGLSDPTSSHRREGLAPRCRLFATWGCSMFQGLGCSPIKAVRELGSERRETVRSKSLILILLSLFSRKEATKPKGRSLLAFPVRDASLFVRYYFSKYGQMEV
ncbi:hypothetical protein E3N88_44457 [Mikania micrantha]|uniref:Uncharacterized protein n=1 Tax=Mikania micrantha TaxID=192012 RepID=A0A5N6LEB9_9ASTR|nr:hypothetical protein E3N88_44457 [Mikania micrantha]